MLKPCKVKTYVTIDNNPKRRLWSVQYKLTDRELPNSFECATTFSQILNNPNGIPNITIGRTLFRNRPYIKILYDWFDEETYYGFDKFRIERREEPWEDATLQNIYECAPADKFIQYLKERGITACPILK